MDVKRILKGFTIYERGGHLGHMTMTIFTNLCAFFPWNLALTFPFKRIGD